MINVYAFTYPGAVSKIPNYVLIKLGDSHRDVEVRIKEQGSSAEYESKIVVGAWNNLKTIKRDFDLHKILIKRGLHHRKGAGTEWFKIPGNTVQDAYEYIDEIIEEIEGKKVRKKVQLRILQQKALDEALEIIDKAIKNGNRFPNVIANLPPRFGKTIWGLYLSNEIFKRYDTRVMLLPAYWLSVHSSFVDELDEFDDFLDVAFIDPNKDDAESKAHHALENGQRIIVPVSLHGDLEEWKEKHSWIAKINDLEKFYFNDEGDFGTHADRQIEKLGYLGEGISIFASGTNVQRLAKGAGKVDGIVYAAYSQLEKTETNIVKRKFYMLEVDSLKKDVESLDEKVQPSWTKIWGKPNGNKAFISKLFLSLTGEEALRQELNLSNLAGESIDCFMLLTSANKKEMKQIKDIAERTVPNYHIKVLNGDYTTNKQAQYETAKEINEARIAGKTGVIIIANQMGSRSYSIPEIQACVIAYDRGSVDATVQKISRCLTPGKTFAGNKKEYGHILDLSFDPNRNENIERLLVDEIIMVQKSENLDFPDAMTFVLSSIDCFKVKYGTSIEVGEDEMFDILDTNETLLRVADVTVDVDDFMDYLDSFSNIPLLDKRSKKEKEAINSAINKIREGDTNNKRNLSDDEKKELEKVINNAIKTLNASATSVFELAEDGNNYKECIDTIKSSEKKSKEFLEIFKVSSDIVEQIVREEKLNIPVLDTIVQKSKKHVDNPFV